MTLPITGTYATYMDAFFGNLSQAEKDELWQRFLTNNGFSISNPPVSGNVSEEELFVQFSQLVLERETTAISPDEIKKRDIMLKTFDILLEMLNTLQNTISVQGQNLIFMGKWQEEYTKKLARVPLYVGGTSSLPNIQKVATLDNLEQFTFGYDKISIDDMANFWAKQEGNNVSGTPVFSITSPTKGDISGSSNDPDCSIFANSVVSPAVTVTGRDFGPGGNRFTFSETIPVSLAADPAKRFAENVENFKQAFVTMWNKPLSGSDSRTAYDLIYSGQTNILSPDNPGRLPQIGWLHNAVTDTDAKARAEYNARNQQFIENLRSLRQIVQDNSKTLQDGLSNTKEALSQQANILQAVIDSLKSLIAAIFR